MIRSRRDFLKLSAVSTLALMGGPVAQRLFNSGAFAETPSRGREYLAICDTKYDTNAFTGTNHEGKLKAWDVASGEVSVTHLPLYGHIVNQSDAKPEYVVTFEKWGTLGAFVDIKAQKALSLIEAVKDSVFFGHSVFNEDASLLMTTEQNYNGTSGKLVVRSVPDMKVVQALPTYGAVPHECRTLDRGKTIIVANSGTETEPSTVVWIDFKTGKLVSQVKHPVNGVLYKHIDFLQDGWACVAARSIPESKEPATELIAFISPEGQIAQPKLPKEVQARIKEECLSIAFLGNSGLLAATFPKSDLLMVFDYKKSELIQVMTLRNPKGVLSGTDAKAAGFEMYVSLSTDRALLSVSEEPHMRPALKQLKSEFGGNGSHLSRIFV